MASSAGSNSLPSRAIERSLIARLMVSNAVAGAAVTTYLVLAADLPPGASRLENLVTSAAGFVVGLLLLSGFALRRGRKILRPAVAWLDEGSEPPAAERAALLALPRRIAFFQLPYWISAGVATG